MKIGIVGSGDVAKALATGLLKHGHAVTLGTRDPGKLEAWRPQQSEVAVAGVAYAVQSADLVILAVKGSAAVQALADVDASALADKVIIDATNPLADAAPQNGVLNFFTGPNESLMERLQSAYPQARFVKAFNQVGNADMIDPQFNGTRPTMFICGNDGPAKMTVSALLEQVGWDVEDFGAVQAARAIEPLCMLWCIRGFSQGQWHHAFKLLK